MTRRIGFQGFAAGADVVLSSDGEAGATGGGGWPAQAQGGTQQSAEIVLRRSQLQVAPEGINFELVLSGFDTPGPAGGSDVYDPQFHDIYYVWDFGDEGAVFTAPEHVPDAHKNANRGYGPLASHTYQTAGTYTVRCLVIEPSSGKAALAEQDITVGDPDVLFAGDRTIFVSTDPTFARAPAGARTVATGDEAYDLQGTLQGASPGHLYRIMFDRDQEHEWHRASIMRPRDNYKNFYFCHSPGSGTPGVIRCSNTSGHSFLEDELTRNSPGIDKDVVVNGLNINGYFDVTEELMGGPYADSHKGGQAFWSIRSPQSATYILFNNVTASGFNTLFTSAGRHQNGPDTLTLIFNNVAITSWSNFGVFEVEPGFTAYTGSLIRQDPLALSGGAKNGLGHNEHGCVRIQLAGKCVMQSCDMFSRNGWFENARGIHTPQPCVRWNQSGDPRGQLNMQGCALESGGRVIESGRDGTINPGVTSNNILIDKCAVVAGVFAIDAVTTQHSGMTMRNCVVVYGGDRSLHGAFGEADFVRLDARWNDPVYLATPNKIYSNTFLNHHSDAQSWNGNASVAAFRLTTVVGADFSNNTITNNVLHQPNLPTPDVPFAPLGTGPLFTPRYDDYRGYNILSDAIELDGDILAGSSFFVPHSRFPGIATQADFDPAPTNLKRDHQFILNNQFGDAAYAFDASGITVTNVSGTAWASGTAVRLNMSVVEVNVRPEYGTPDDIVWEAVPLEGSTAIGAALSGPSALDDFYGYARPQYPSLGAFEVTF